eukprot:757379-Hanusia_phi.AAC.18
MKGAFVEPSVKDCGPGKHFQFERLGYFVTDTEDSKPGSLVFNRVVTLRDNWSSWSSSSASSSSSSAPAAASQVRLFRLIPLLLMHPKPQQNADKPAAPSADLEDVRRLDIRVGK